MASPLIYLVPKLESLEWLGLVEVALLGSNFWGFISHCRLHSSVLYSLKAYHSLHVLFHGLSSRVAELLTWQQFRASKSTKSGASGLLNAQAWNSHSDTTIAFTV